MNSANLLSLETRLKKIEQHMTIISSIAVDITNVTSPIKPRADQMIEFSDMVQKIAETSTMTALQQLSEDRELTSDKIRLVINSKHRLKNKMVALVKDLVMDMSVVPTPVTKCIVSGKSISYTDGTQTIECLSGKDFRVYHNSQYADRIHQVVSTEEQQFEVHELINSANLPTIFKSFDRDLDDLCFTEAQIVEFIRHYLELFLGQRLYTFLLFKRGGMFFSSIIKKDLGKNDLISVSIVNIFSHCIDYHAGCKPRIVIPVRY